MHDSAKRAVIDVRGDILNLVVRLMCGTGAARSSFRPDQNQGDREWQWWLGNAVRRSDIVHNDELAVVDNVKKHNAAVALCESPDQLLTKAMCELGLRAVLKDIEFEFAVT